MKTSQPGINWIWYFGDTKEEAEEYYEEVMGHNVSYDWEIIEVEESKWGWRVHR